MSLVGDYLMSKRHKCPACGEDMTCEELEHHLIDLMMHGGHTSND